MKQCNVFYLSLEYPRGILLQIENFRLLHCAVTCYDTDVSDYATSIFTMNMTFRNVSILPHHNTVLKPRRSQLESSSPWRSRLA